MDNLPFFRDEFPGLTDCDTRLVRLIASDWYLFARPNLHEVINYGFTPTAGAEYADVNR
jgi:hypothetical protein